MVYTFAKDSLMICFAYVLHRTSEGNCSLSLSLFLLHFHLTSPLPSSFHRGSAISKIIGFNVLKSLLFHHEVNMWVFEEVVNGRKLSEIINTDHVNVKYLPGVTLPDNVVST